MEIHQKYPKDSGHQKIINGNKHIVAQEIFDYLNHKTSLQEIVAWCENVMMDGDIEEQDIDIVSEVVTKIGLADTHNFGLLWEDCDEMLSKLGYKLHLDLLKVA
jgi:hypothetical protein